MRDSLAIFHILVAARELAANSIGDAQAPRGVALDALIDRVSKSPLNHIDLDSTTFAKAGQLASPTRNMPVDLLAVPTTRSSLRHGMVVQSGPAHLSSSVRPFASMHSANILNQRRVAPSATPIRKGPSGADRLKAFVPMKELAAAMLSGLLLSTSCAVAPPPALAVKELGAFSGNRANKDPESLLRYGLPIKNDAVRELQVTLEDAKDVTDKQQWPKVSGFLSKAQALSKNSGPILKSIPGQSAGEAKRLADELPKDITDITDFVNAKDRDGALNQEELALNKISKLEEMMMGDGLPFKIPAEYVKKLPVLNGRAKVEMVLKKTEGKFFSEVKGKRSPETKILMTLDGYNAPVTAGNFVDLVRRGFYNGMKIQRSDGFVVQTGDPDGPDNPGVGFTDNGELRNVPLEVFIKGDKEPLYMATPEEDGRKNTVATLPFQSTGALGMARSEFDNGSGSSQYFWLLYDSELTPAGRNLLDGRYSCFGYTTEGSDFLRDLEVGDEIVSAKIIEGADKLQQP